MSIVEYFSDLPDPRRSYLTSHRLLDIVTITLCGLLAGADTWVEIELFARTREAWLRRFLELPAGIPTHDTLARVFAALDPHAFTQAFAQWVEAVRQTLPVPASEPLKVRAIDGKQMRGTACQGGTALDVVRVWASETRLILAQEAVAEKSNEITAIPVVLRQLDLAGCLVTSDAMGCQRAIAQQIRDQGGEYILALKGNQGTLHQEVIDSFTEAEASQWDGVAHQTSATQTAGHGRLERRQHTVITDAAVVDWLQSRHHWPGLQAIGRIASQRQIGAQVAQETRYYLLSAPLSAATFGIAVRTHWQIENSVHWVLDIAFQEDASRSRTGHEAANLAILRSFALTLLKHNPSVKAGIKAKRMVAAWDSDFLLALLS